MVVNNSYTKVKDILTGFLRSKDLVRFGQFFLIVLILTDIVLLTLVSFIPVSDQFILYISIFDLIVVLILIPEFILRFKKAENKKEFLKYNGIDVLGMIPEIILGPYSTAFRYLRLIRILILLKMQIRHILAFLHKNKIDYGIFVVGIVLLSGSIIFYIFEAAANPDINSFSDSLWFLVVTITTVGYGDITPVTNAGRVVGTLIIVIGIGFVSFLTATITSIFIKDTEKEEMDKIDVLHDKIDNLEFEIKELKEILKEK